MYLSNIILTYNSQKKTPSPPIKGVKFGELQVKEEVTCVLPWPNSMQKIYQCAYKVTALSPS